MKVRRIMIIVFLGALFIFSASICFSEPEETDEAFIELSSEEKAFIQEHPLIKLAIDSESVPYEFIDKDGKYKGITADYIKIIEQRTGLVIKPELGLSWAESYDKACAGELDVLGCVSKAKIREGNFIHTEPYYSIKRVFFIVNNNSNIKSFEDLHGKSVAVQKNTSHYEFLKEYEDIKIVEYVKLRDAISAVSEGKQDAFIANLATSSYIIKSMGISNLSYIEIDSEYDELLYFAVRKDWPILVGILNKGILSITEEEKIEINNKWVGIEEKPDYSFLFKIFVTIALLVGLIIGVSAYWIFLLKKEMNQRKKIDEELLKAKEEAELANNIKSTFLARMSHEIRTPLNAINGMAYLLKKTDVSVTQKIYLDKITQASIDMLSIINDILDFSKIESGKVQLERVSFNIDKVIQQVVNIVSFRVESSEIDFVVDRQSGIPVFFFGDPMRLEQILLNLINNAIKFTKKGSVTLEVRLVGKKDNDYQLQFSVKDTGIGMSQPQLDTLFEPFNQADLTINRRFGGTGLGLSIVKNLVTMMGGTVEVTSEEGKGSTFIVTIKLEEDKEREEEQWKNKTPISDFLAGLKVLIVEKNIKTLQILLDYLKSFEITADYAVNEEAALLEIEKAVSTNKKIDLLILDYETPKEGGLVFYQQIKERTTKKNMPKTILLVPVMKEEIFEKMSGSGIELGLSKPIVPSSLYNGILEIFNKRVKLISNDEELNDFEYEKAPGGCHILVIEDNKTNQFIAKSILEQSGFIVALADNGKEGYNYFNENHENINLVLMDLHMPDINGFETTAMIKKVNDKIPVIAMTADAINGVAEECKEFGMVDYISKPFEPKTFIDTIKRVLISSAGENPCKCLEEIKTKPKRIRKNKVKKEPKILDKEEGIKRVGGDAGIYYKVLAEYYKESLADKEELRNAIIRKEYKQAKQFAHKIKGSSGSIGAKSVYEASTELQAALFKENEEEITTCYSKFEEVIELLMAEIKDSMW